MDGFDITIMIPALIAGIIVLLTHVPLGIEVLKRGIIFIDLAVAQIAGLGVIVAYVAGFGEHGMVAQLAAVTSALFGAWLLSLCERQHGEHQEAVIGISFILAATAGILLLAHNPHGGEHLREMLVGQILWVQFDQLVVAAVISLIIVLLWQFTGLRRTRYGFYTLFAIAVTVSVQLVGVYLVFASLIIPALAVAIVAAPNRYIMAYAIGIKGYLTGLLVSLFTDLPSGALIVWGIASVALIYVLLFRPASGGR